MRLFIPVFAYLTALTLSANGQLKKAGEVSLHANSHANPLQQLRDSLEVEMLKGTRSYEQINLIIRTVDHSAYLDLLPSVLPVDLPIEQFRLTSPFGLRNHPVLRKTRFHSGIDVQAPKGLPVKATAPGYVHEVGYDPSLGAFVRLRHSLGFETLYGHLSGFCVKPGQCVDQNEEIGRVGQSGLATGPHLHYTIKKNGSIIDPFQFCFLLRRRLMLIDQSRSPVVSGTSSNSSSLTAVPKVIYPN